jgi:hypothetical protein
MDQIVQTLLASLGLLNVNSMSWRVRETFLSFLGFVCGVRLVFVSHSVRLILRYEWLAVMIVNLAEADFNSVLELYFYYEYFRD